MLLFLSLFVFCIASILFQLFFLFWRSSAIYCTSYCFDSFNLSIVVPVHRILCLTTPPISDLFLYFSADLFLYDSRLITVNKKNCQPQKGGKIRGKANNNDTDHQTRTIYRLQKREKQTQTHIYTEMEKEECALWLSAWK